MAHASSKSIALAALVVTVALALLLPPVPQSNAADHGDSPTPNHDQGLDIGDVYFFLDPNDNSKVIIASDVHGFIVPAENANLGFFDNNVRFHYQIENTGDARGDLFIDVTFSKQTSR